MLLAEPWRGAGGRMGETVSSIWEPGVGAVAAYGGCRGSADGSWRSFL